MTGCARCCLHKSLRIVNLIMLLFGTAMIAYSLWLQRMWNDGIALLPSHSSLPIPWFIFTCLGLGIAVCLNTLCGHILSNCISKSALCILIVFFCCAIFLEIAVIVSIFFKMDWQLQISAHIDKYHQAFERFVIFHVKMCRWVALLALAAQINVVVLAVAMYAVGTEPRTHCEELYVPSFTQSFLVPTLPAPVSGSSHACRRWEMPFQGNPRQSILSLIVGTLRAQFRRIYTVY